MFNTPMSSDNAYEVLQNIASISGIRNKKTMLKKHPELATIIKYALDPLYKYNITIPTKIENEAIGMEISEKYFKILDELRLNFRRPTNETIDIICDMRNKLSYKSALLYTNIVNKSLRIGLSVKSINTIWPDHLYDFSVMLAQPYAKAKHKLKYPCYVSRKIDGVRAIYKDGVFLSRTGHTYYGLEHLQAKLQFVGNIELDGELTVLNKSFHEGSGLIRSHNPTPDAVYNIFDVPDFKESLKYRIEYLMSLFINKQDQHINVIPHLIVNSYDEVLKKYKFYRDLGYEGVMLKNIDSLYKRSRSMDWIKIKNLQSCTLRVIDIETGKGKYTDCVGKLICKLPNGGVVSVGSGLSDADRYNFMTKESIIDKLIEIEYHEVTVDGSLREPRFKGIRHDKINPDITLIG